MREHQPDSSRTLAPLRAQPHLYEIHTWAWLEQLSATAGKPVTLADVTDSEWDALAERGFDVVWLMGVWERSPRGRRIARTETTLFSAYDEGRPGWKLEDIVGSPYAIHCYHPDKRIGSWDDMDAVRAKLHARGMRLLLDFVANHTAPDHPWVTQQPEVYVQGTLAEYRQDPGAFTLVEDGGHAFFVARGRDPNYPPWTDTAQINHFHPAARAALLDTLRELARHCDGVRCDMAMLSLNDVFDRTWGHLVDEPRPATEFWSDAVAAVPGFLWLGEVYWDMERRLQQIGFQFTYDKTLFDRLRYAAPADVNQYLGAPADSQSRMARFLENHDEGRSVAVFGRDRVEALAALHATLPGMRFYHHGQMEGRRRKLPVQMARPARETPDSNLRMFYERLLLIAGEDVFHTGQWRLLDARPAGDSTDDALVCYEWRAGSVWKIVVVNLSGGAAQGNLDLAAEVDAARAYTFLDQLNGAIYERHGEDLARWGLFIRLDAYRAHIFDVRTR